MPPHPRRVARRHPSRRHPPHPRLHSPTRRRPRPVPRSVRARRRARTRYPVRAPFPVRVRRPASTQRLVRGRAMATAKVDRPPRASPLSSGRIPSPVSVASRSRAPHRRNPRAVPVRLRDRAGLRLPVVPAPVRPLRVHVRVRHRRTCVVRELRVRATTRSRRRRGWARPVVPPSRVPVAAMVALPVRVRAVRRVPAAATGCRVRIPR